MNYLSHYFLDARPGEIHYNFGLVLPDMMGTAQRGWKPIISTEHTKNEVKQLTEGIKRHLEADADFHSSTFFRDESVQLRKQLEKFGFAQEGSRLFFVAHVLLEFLLDRLIIQDHLHIPHSFYDDIEAVDNEAIINYLPGIFHPQHPFFTFLDRFKQHRYLFSYTEDEKLLFALNRTMMRARQQPFPEQKLIQFSELVSVSIYDLGKKYLGFFEELRNNY